MKHALSLLFLLILSAQASARVFNFKDSGLGVMLRGTGGTSGLGKEPFVNSSGTNTSIDDETKYSYGGELGVVLGIGDGFNVRMAAEVIQHHPVHEGHGNNSTSGAERFQFDSSTFVFNPNVAVEIFLDGGASTRYFAQIGAGYAMVDVENRYRMTATGASELGVTDFNEKMSGAGISGLIGLGFETVMLDNVTFSIDGGYRYMKVNSLRYTGDVNNIVAPTGARKKDEALNHDGSKRALNLSGAFVGASLRFHLHFL